MRLHSPQVKVVGVNGQVSIGKECAGKTVLIDQINETTWVIKTGIFIPDAEKWLHQSHNLTNLEKALEWAEKNPPIDNFDQITKDFKGE